jgi:hypothetical protein
VDRPQQPVTFVRLRALSGNRVVAGPLPDRN